MKKHKTTLVTGGTSGIGLAVARKLAKEGHNLVLIGSNPARDYDSARRDVEEAAEEAGYQRSILTWGVDITDFKAVRQMMRQISEAAGPFDGLVHSAGVFFNTPVTSDGPEDFSRMMAVNVQGMWNVVQAALPFMRKKDSSAGSTLAGARPSYTPYPAKSLREQTGAKIVAISSICAFYSFAGYSGYSASKAAVTALVRSLALELGPMGININAVEPGRVETSMHSALLNDSTQEAALRAIADANPSRRAFSSPEDIANVVSFLLSSQAVALHGASIVVDEGLSLGV